MLKELLYWYELFNIKSTKKGYEKKNFEKHRVRCSFVY